MLQLFVSIHLVVAGLLTSVAKQMDVLGRARSDRGSVTIEQVLWAVAVITIVTVVVIAIKTFVRDQADQIKPVNPLMQRSGAASRARDRGSVSIEMVLLFPLALTLLFLAVQAAVYYQGRSVALASAQQGAREAAQVRAVDADGQRSAEQFAQRAGKDGILESPKATVSREEQSVTVTVTGRTLSLIPGWDPQVTQSATRPLEQFTTPVDPVNPDGLPA